MDIRRNAWSEDCIRACLLHLDQAEQNDSVAELTRKLGEADGIVDTGADLGCISSYMQSRFGFAANCHVSAFTGEYI